MPVGLIFGVAVPVLLLVIFGTIPAMNKPAGSLGGLTYFSVFFPILIVFVVGMLSLISLPVRLATYREQGILRRMSTTPVPPAWMLAAQVIINLALAVVALGILVLAGTVGFGLGAPKAAGGFTLALILTIAAMFAIGLWVSAIARTAGWQASSGNCSCIPCSSSLACGCGGTDDTRAPAHQRLVAIGCLCARAAKLDAGHIPPGAIAPGHRRLGCGVRLPGRALLQVGVGAACLMISAERGGGQNVHNNSQPRRDPRKNPA